MDQEIFEPSALSQIGGLVLFAAATALVYGLQEGMKAMAKRYDIDVKGMFK